ncbi:hypothetical protein [Streptomyces canus]|uniref:hypothetical protein n=1 Tax=Streptomyces canus TaxID=58343 RepID=UPI003F4B7D91
MLQGLVNACGLNSSWNSEEAVIALVESRPAWLEPVWSDEHRRLYRVRDGVSLVSAPARVACSPWMRVDGGCLREEGGFTRLTVGAGGCVPDRVGVPLAGVECGGC